MNYLIKKWIESLSLTTWHLKKIKYKNVGFGAFYAWKICECIMYGYECMYGFCKKIQHCSFYVGIILSYTLKHKIVIIKVTYGFLN